MIQLSSVTKSFGARVLLEDVTWQVSDRETVGLCGPNGAGKTTLLRIFADLDEPDAGAVTKPSGLRVGYLPQDGLTHEGHTLHEEAALAFEWLLDVRKEMQSIEDRLADPAVPEGEHEAMLHRYSDLQDRFRLHDGYAIDLKIDTVLRGLGFSPADYDKPTATFSGGWQMRIALAKLLLAKPDLLLLDEPTNHLDLDARNWLEDYLHDYPHAVILVSHDRFFLDAVVDRITDIHLRTLVDYACNYSTVPRPARRAPRAPARRQAAAGRGGGAHPDVHQPVPVYRHQGRAGAGPGQDAREGGAHRGAARAQARALHVPDVREERPDGVRPEGRAQGVRLHARLRRHRSRSSSAATASRCSARTAPASRR